MNKSIAINSKIERLQKELALHEKVLSILPKELHEEVLIVNSTLYGKTASLLFKGSKTSLSDLLSIFNPVLSAKWKGVFDYTVPECYDILKEKDSKANFQGHRDATAIISCNGYKIDFYAELGGFLFDITVDYMDIIIGNNYSTLATGKMLPHLRENPQYTKNGQHGAMYRGVSGAPDTNNYEVRQAITFKYALEVVG